MITCAYLFAVSVRPRVLYSNTSLDNGNRFTRLWENSLPVSVVCKNYKNNYQRSYDDAFVNQVELLSVELSKLLVYFISSSVKFDYVKSNTHDVLTYFWCWWKLSQHLGSTKDNERDQCQTVCQTLLNLNNFLQTHQTDQTANRWTIRNYQKQKRGLFMTKHCLGNSQIISIPE